MNFIGRTDEFTTSLIFGRRRVGKSESIKTALKNNSSVKIYYECKEVSEKSNVDGLSDILSQSHVSSGPTLVDVLDKIIRMDVVSKTSPINDLNNKKKCGYYISDNLSLFYYRYIFKYSSQMKIMDPNIFYAKYIEKDFEQQYVPHIFERICKQYLIIKNKNGEIDLVFEKIGKYYYDNPIEHTNGEFDVVTEDEKGYFFYETKFRKNSITNTIIQNEIKQVNLTDLNCYKYVFISRSGFMCEQQENVQLIDLNEFYDIKKA